MSDELAGRRIGVTAARKADEQIELLRRRGAEVLHAPSVEYVSAESDEQLRAGTDELVSRGADVTVITTGMGLRRWLAAAGDWDQGQALRDALAASSIVARGPKAAGAVREAGLRESYSPASETDAEVCEYLLGSGVRGRRVVLQSHGEPVPWLVERLRASGAEVTEVLPYRWRAPADTAPIDELVGELGRGGMDAVTFTSAPAALGLLRAGGDAAVAGLRRTLVACVGPVTAQPLRDAGLDVVLPQRARTAALVRDVAARLGELS